MYGPKGVGALYVRRRNPRVLLAPIIDGGGHERGMRSGTLNVTGIVGFGKAAELCKQEMAAESERLRELRDYLNDKLHKQLDEALHQRLDGAPAAAQPEHQLRLRRRRVAADGHQRRRRSRPGRPARRRASSRPTCSRRSAPATIWRTRRSASASAAGRPKEEVDYVGATS